MLSNLIKCLVNIQNGSNGFVGDTVVPRTFVNSVVLDMLVDHGYISFYFSNSPHTYRVAMKYTNTGQSSLKKFHIVSTPSRRVFMTYEEIAKRFSGNQGLVVISTSHSYPKEFSSHLVGSFSFTSRRLTGLLSHKEVIHRRIGGEILFAAH